MGPFSQKDRQKHRGHGRQVFWGVELPVVEVIEYWAFISVSTDCFSVE
jgi:hypothetical protein